MVRYPVRSRTLLRATGDAGGGLRPFTIAIADATLADLRERLARVRWPDTPPGAGWDYGTDLAYLREFVAYWRDVCDWRVHEARLNAFAQYAVPLAGIDPHVIHQPGVGPDPLPLLLSHGWPGSVWSSRTSSRC